MGIYPINEINNESKKINKNKRNSIRNVTTFNKNSKTNETSNSKNRKGQKIKTTKIKKEKAKNIKLNQNETKNEDEFNEEQFEKEQEEEEKKQIEKQIQFLKEIQEKEKKEEILNKINQENREIQKEKETQVKNYLLEKNIENLVKKNYSKNKRFSKEHLNILNDIMLQNKLNLEIHPYEKVVEPDENEKKISPVEKKKSLKLENNLNKLPKKNLIYDNSYLLKKNTTEDNFTPRIKEEVLDILNNTPSSNSNSKKHKFHKKIHPFKKKNPEIKKNFSKHQINRMTQNKLFIDQNDIDYINSLERKRKLKELEEEKERKKNENFLMELKNLFENIQKLKNSKNDVTEEIEKLIDKQVENSEYAQFRKLEMRINDFKKNLDKDILMKKNYKQNILKLKYKSPFYFFKNYNEIKDNYDKNNYKGAFYIKKKIKKRRSSLFDDLNNLENNNNSINSSSSSSEKSF